MNFDPVVGQTITIARKQYTFTEHPAAPGLPYAQSGRKGTVYQLIASDSSLHALKVFKLRWQDPRTASTAQQLTALANDPELEGLDACQRYVITAENEPLLLKENSALHFAVFMPWACGETWHDLFLAHPFSPSQCLAVAQAFARVMNRLELRGMAHCDLSGPNVMVDMRGPSVLLVDLEDIYAPGIQQVPLDRLPAGTDGYTHPAVRAGLWREEADRFSGAVLLAEMLSAFDDQVRQAVGEGYFFEQDEIQTDCARYHQLMDALRGQWGEALAGLFEQAWKSRSLADCPPFSAWISCLEEAQGRPASDNRYLYLLEEGEKQINRGEYHRAVLLLERAYRIRQARSGGALSRALVGRSEKKRTMHDWQGAQADLWRAAELLPDGAARKRVLQRAASLNRQIQAQRLRQGMTRVALPWREILRGLIFLVMLALISAAGLVAYQRYQVAGLGAIQGTVLDSETNNSLAGATVLLRAGQNQASAASDSQGVFQFEKISIGKVTLDVQLDGYTAQPIVVEAKRSTTVTVEVRMKLVGARLNGDVFDASTGKGLEGAAVRAYGTYSNGEPFSQSATTGADGHYDLMLIGAGQGTIVISRDGYEGYTPLAFRIVEGEVIAIPGAQLYKK